MRIHIDIETRSAVDLRKTGVYPYAESSTTEILCIAGEDWLWVPSKFDRYVEGNISTEQLTEILLSASEIVAHNMQFERVLLREKGPLYGIPDIDPSVWRCSMQQCGAVSLPLGLGKAAKALGVSEQKDDEGHKLMLKMSRPKRCTGPSEPDLFSQL